MAEQDDTAHLRRNMLRRQFYLIFMTVKEPLDDPRKAFFETYRETFDAHTKWLAELEQSGVMFASGPLRDETDWDGSGMAIIRASSLGDAKALAEAEPFHVAGIRKNEVRGWMMNEGGFTLSVKFMAGSVELF